MGATILERIGSGLAHYLDQPSKRYVTFSVSPIDRLAECLQPGDVLLVEGDRRVSVAIKYLTQSTWSHAAFYVGPDWSGAPDGTSAPRTLIEADLQEGVIAVPLAKYESLNTRICRPVGLSKPDRRKVVGFMLERLGMQYDLKNIIDLMRYLLPTPPVPVPWRRRMLALGSGDPTRAICSTLIAQAFQSVRYPILPHVREEATYDDALRRHVVREYLHIRHHSLFTPRDFDISPYFSVIKPTLEGDFDYRRLNWYDGAPESAVPAAPADEAPEEPPPEEEPPTAPKPKRARKGQHARP